MLFISEIQAGSD